MLALTFLEAFQLLQGGKHGPGLAVYQAHQSLAATGGRFKGEPGIGDPVCLICLAVDLEVARLG
jgi:hypothetical protein